MILLLNLSSCLHKRIKTRFDWFNDNSCLSNITRDKIPRDKIPRDKIPRDTTFLNDVFLGLVLRTSHLIDVVLATHRTSAAKTA